MLGARLKQLREYNGIKAEKLAEFLGIAPQLYNDFEDDKLSPTIEIIEKLAVCYKITINELYGCSPMLAIYDKLSEDESNNVDNATLKMADLSWDEIQLLFHYRNMTDMEKKEELIQKIIHN